MQISYMATQVTCKINESDVCAICLNERGPVRGIQQWAKLPCGHTLHSSCYRQMPAPMKCPECRRHFSSRHIRLCERYESRGTDSFQAPLLNAQAQAQSTRQYDRLMAMDLLGGGPVGKRVKRKMPVSPKRKKTVKKTPPRRTVTHRRTRKLHTRGSF